MGKLTARKVQTLKEPGRYSDGDGLMLFIDKSGSKRWVLRIQAAGRRRDIGLGSVTIVSLADARDMAHEMRKVARTGEDPVADRKRKQQRIPTFEEAARAVHKEHLPSWRNVKHAAQWINTLETYIFPDFGRRTVDQVDGPVIRDALIKIWLDKPETARRVLQRIGSVLDYCHAKGWREAEAPMRSVTRGLPKQPKSDRHLAALPWEEVPAFVSGMKDALKTGEHILLAMELLILTATRSGEIRGARWKEFDLDQKTWEIPADRMKAGRAHRVPLSDRAVELLTRMHELRRSSQEDALVFEGQRAGRPLSDMTLTQPLRRAGLKITAHGFRSSFRDWAAEATGFPRELAEKALAHTLRDKTESAYQRGDLFEKRRKLMAAWAAYCTSTGGKVVLINRLQHQARRK